MINLTDATLDLTRAEQIVDLLTELANYEHEYDTDDYDHFCQFCDQEYNRGVWHNENCPVHIAQNMLIESGIATEDSFDQRNVTPPPPTVDQIIDNEKLNQKVYFALYQTNDAGLPIKKIGTFPDFFVNTVNGNLGVIEIVKRLDDTLTWEKPYNANVETCFTEQAPGYMIKRVEL